MANTIDIGRLGQYFRSIEQLDGSYIVRVILPERWAVENSADGLIRATRSENALGEWYFWGAKGKNVSIDEIFDFIEDTINFNKDAKARIDLLMKKIDELKEFFANHSLDELRTLRFVTGTTELTHDVLLAAETKKRAQKASKSPKKASSKKKAEPKNNVEEVMDAVFNDEGQEVPDVGNESDIEGRQQDE